MEVWYCGVYSISILFVERKTELAFAKLGRDLYSDEMVEARSNWMAIQCDQHRCEELYAS